MKSLTDFAFNEEYKRVKRLGDRLAEIESLLDWEAFRPIVGEMYENKSDRGGRPNIDEVVMVKLLVLQQWHGLSDPELEKQVADRLSFRKFLGFPETIFRIIRRSGTSGSGWPGLGRIERSGQNSRGNLIHSG
jgi:IS5 family transposase